VIPHYQLGGLTIRRYAHRNSYMLIYLAGGMSEADAIRGVIIKLVLNLLYDMNKPKDLNIG